MFGWAPQEEYEVELEAVEEVFLQEREALLAANKVQYIHEYHTTWCLVGFARRVLPHSRCFPCSQHHCAVVELPYTHAITHISVYIYGGLL